MSNILVFDRCANTYIKLKRSNEKQYLYRIISGINEKIITQEPRDVIGGDEEPDIKRICTSTTITGCILSVGEFCGNEVVYRTKRKVYSYYPVNVIDANITKERWLLKNTKFIKIGKFGIIDKNKLKVEYMLFSNIKVDINKLNDLIKRRNNLSCVGDKCSIRSQKSIMKKYKNLFSIIKKGNSNKIGIK